MFPCVPLALAPFAMLSIVGSLNDDGNGMSLKLEDYVFRVAGMNYLRRLLHRLLWTLTHRRNKWVPNSLHIRTVKTNKLAVNARIIM